MDHAVWIHVTHDPLKTDKKNIVLIFIKMVSSQEFSEALEAEICVFVVRSIIHIKSDVIN